MFLDALAKGAGTEKRAALQAKVSMAEVREWLKDPDFAVSVTGAKEYALESEESNLDTIENKIYEVAMESDVRLGMEVLRARRPNRWNPAIKIEVGEIKHRFLDFTGKPLHQEREISGSPGLPDDVEDGSASDTD